MSSQLRLEEAVRLIIHKEIKENCDDTLVEKLVTYLQEKRDVGNLDDFNVEKLLRILDEAINERKQSVDTVDINAVLLILGAILNRATLCGESSSVKNCLEEILCILPEIKADFGDFSLHYAYFRCLTDVGKIRTGRNFLLQKSGDLFSPLVALDVIKHSKSHFVRISAEKFITTVVSLSILDADENCAIISNVVHRIISDKTLLRLVKPILEWHDDCGRYLLEKHNLFSVFQRCLTDYLGEDALVVLISECLGSVVTKDNQINAVFRNLTSTGHLKGLAAFAEALTSRNKKYINKWFTFAVYPLISHLNLSLNPVRNYLFSYDQALVENKSSQNLVKFLLPRLNLTARHLSHTEMNVMLDVMQIFFLSVIGTSRNIKMLRTSLDLLANLPFFTGSNLESGIDSNGPRNLAEKALEIVINLMEANPECQHCEEWRTIRIILTEMETNKILSSDVMLQKLCKKVLAVLKWENASEINNETDSALEVLVILSSMDEYLFSVTCPELASNFWSVCRISLSNPAYTSILSSCLPLLIDLHFQLEEEELMTLEVRKYIDLLNVFKNLLESTDCVLKSSAIDSFSTKRNLRRLTLLSQTHTDCFYKNVASPLFKIVSFDVDAEVQLKALEFLRHLLPSIISHEANNIHGLVEIWRNFCLFDSLFYASSNTYSLAVRKEAESLKNAIKEHLVPSISSEDMKRILQVVKDGERPTTLFTVNEQTSETFQLNTQPDRNAVLDEIFSDMGQPPLTTLVEQLQRAESYSSPKILMSSIPPVDCDLLMEFLFKDNELTFETPIICILDDIIAAKAIHNTTAMDCY